IDQRLLVVAKLSLLAHLKKLEAERCVETDGAEQWRLSN
ncbi:MAG: Beta-lactamase associated winged helix domain, partial [Pseudomonadota bacterium]